MSFNEHLTRDHLGNYWCSHFVECEDCKYDGNCVCQNQMRESEDGER